MRRRELAKEKREIHRAVTKSSFGLVVLWTVMQLVLQLKSQQRRQQLKLMEEKRLERRRERSNKVLSGEASFEVYYTSDSFVCFEFYAFSFWEPGVFMSVYSQLLKSGLHQIGSIKQCLGTSPLRCSSLPV